MKRILGASILTVACATEPIDESKIVDLSHAFDASTVYWPTAKRFELSRVAWGQSDDGDWYASNDFAASEHGGTHLDAPIHFAEGRSSTAEIPLARLIGPARVIDVRQSCESDRDYLLATEDVLAHEARFGPIERGSVVLVLTGYDAYYPDAKRYLGNDERGVADDLHFPGIGSPAAQMLVDRKVDLVGIDTASLDNGPSGDFAAHRILNGADVPGLENLTGLDRLPPRGATLIALPMKISGGTGGPCRVIALLP